ncbi:MAG: phenylalanine--tRNA ligase subunit alpha [Deltaproteobacteria bacterium]|nr:phenylalanine--tRNA ligase subunit alpha [Deltaproteobacteria bacterium]
MKAELERLRGEAEAALARAVSDHEIADIKARFLGKAGSIQATLKGLGKLPAVERPEAGRIANEVRQAVEAAVEGALTRVATEGRAREIATRIEDVTLVGRRPPVGALHPLTQTWYEIRAVFASLGFAVVDGPLVETDWYNFEALGVPADHPARDMQDTFFVEGGALLRTHTSPTQVRVMEREKPPIRIIAPGHVFRRDDDVTHSPEFQQVEGLWVDEHITFGDLKGVLAEFARRMFGAATKIRLRPSYFPFTEPSAEVDVSCLICGGRRTGCRVCKETGWLEILGAGSVDPLVFENVKYDPERVTGFAFGMGIERIAMLTFGISDIRLFYQNDVRFLRQFA